MWRYLDHHDVRLQKAMRRNYLSLAMCYRNMDVLLIYLLSFFWNMDVLVTPNGIVKSILDVVSDSWLSARARQAAAHEALSMIKATRNRWKENAVKPLHRGERMMVSSTIALLEEAESTSEFDAWLHLRCIGRKIILDLPIRFHKHFNRLARKGKRLNSYIITRKDVQFVFDLEVPEPRMEPVVGVDTGINVLASLSSGEQLGEDVRAGIDRINGCQHGSNGQQRAVRALKQRIDETARDVVQKCGTVVVENLKGICNRTKERVGKTTRRLLGRWQVRHWMTRLEQRCQMEGRSFHVVSARYTSQTCHTCGHVEQGNREGRKFLCRKCGYADDADINAAKNILSRFLTGAACGPGSKALA